MLATHGSSTGRDHHRGREIHLCQPSLQETLLLSQCLGSFPHLKILRYFGVFFSIDTHSFWYNFTIIRLPRHGQQWCEVQVQVDQKNFLSYDCGSDKVLPMGHLEEQLEATDAWGKQLEMLREVGQRLRLELADTELEDFTPSGEWWRPRTEGSRVWAQGLHFVWVE